MIAQRSLHLLSFVLLCCTLGKLGESRDSSVVHVRVRPAATSKALASDVDASSSDISAAPSGLVPEAKETAQIPKHLIPRSCAASQTCDPNIWLNTEHPSTEPNRILDNQKLFSVYVHTPPWEGFRETSLFYQHEIEDGVRVDWGMHSVVIAMRLLIKAALNQSLNKAFVFLCESTLPLYPPTVVWQQLISERRSRVQACFIPENDKQNHAYKDRWSAAMLPFIGKKHWLKSDQWLSLTRKHARIINEDSVILHTFKDTCMHCVGDEQYFANLLARKNLSHETTCTCGVMAKTWTGGSSPMVFQAEDFSKDLIMDLRQGPNPQKSCMDEEAIRVANANFMRTSRKWEPSCDDAELFVPQFNGSLIDPMKDCPLFGRQFDSAMASSPSVLLDLFQIHSTT